MNCPALPALALLSLSAGLAAAQTPPEAIVAPGIYAAMQAPVDVTALPPAALEQGAKLCKNTPSLVYADGLMRALKPADMEAAVAGGPFFVRAGGMRCPQMGGTEVACRSIEGAQDRPGEMLSVTFTALEAGAYRLGLAGRSFAIVLMPCEAQLFDIEGPGGRNVLDDLLKRDDGGPAIPRPTP
ncbi:hypothetical protein [Rhodobacter xanthinilyticus]|uniref:hypothetical protein n=1 Tax=Rhodobacter xanthinilyticus TaxID=1850250 RepID=UPI0012EB4CF4|nr:hypothetical protein [Rhodobacter xanthinilyticus]